MSRPLTLLLKAKPKSDDVDDVYNKIVGHVRSNEPGTLTFRMFKEDDETIRFYDDYASSERFIEHFQNVKGNGLLDELMEACNITETVCLGDPTPQAREILDQFGATYASHVSGFSRLQLEEPATA